ncbi:hypothetical protein EDE08_109359 [Bradyrhizobium sp. R2.2-H]|jgi:hypothetical protein|uniref:hypothetical protein n=1 Tax=unclassified Bradyrhizobium TaxID=2631580 RepID=UPI0010499534|nr:MULTISPECIES: hypothetical protein [unclassified Bradyrhizobium]TCU68244.1 hypothetical protein EDE10_10954 [Bradyrhizobium sp. Y-H1]TCU70134.1 hypothetical protein EDE08_109359 [Bradyrhizobium sp. R2.2-H]
MPADKAPIENDNAADAKVKLRSLADLDGRTLAARTAKALIAELASDMGGVDRLSAAERALIHRAALAGAMADDMEATWLSGRPIDVAAYTTLVNAQRRLLATVGLKRQPHDVTPDLDDYVARKTSSAFPPPPPPGKAP